MSSSTLESEMDQVTPMDTAGDEAAGVPPLDRRVSYRISRLHGRLNAQAARILSATAGISLSQWRILVMIDAEAEISASEIVRMTKIDKAMVSRAIKSLSEDGLVKVVVSKADQRLHNVRMTPAGRERFMRAFPHMLDRQNSLVDRLAEGEAETLFRLLGKIEDAITAMEGGETDETATMP
ncbi:MAG: MarR family winged helix-turn-helix transcriptional regulator [Pseudomonadota bacterium]